jgi:hypothetical protein
VIDWMLTGRSPATDIRRGCPGGGVEDILLGNDPEVKQCLVKPCFRSQSRVKINAKSQKISTLPDGDSGDQNKYINQQTV